MPIEALLLRGSPIPLEKCPKCNASPFEPFMRGQVQRSPLRMAWLWLVYGWKKRHDYPRYDRSGKPILNNPPTGYCALICSSCQEIVGHE